MEPPKEIQERIINTKIDFVKPIEAARKKNVVLLIKEIKSPDTKEKVENWAERWGFEPETVYQKIQEMTKVVWYYFSNVSIRIVVSGAV